MAYKTEDLLAKAKKAIGESACFFIEDVIAQLPCGKGTFYEHFPTDSNELNDIKDLLDDNKIKTKLSIRAKLHKGTKAAELIALYKLICTPEERAALSMQKIDITTGGKELPAPVIQFGDVDPRDGE